MKRLTTCIDGFAFLVGAFGKAPARNSSPTFIIGGFFFCSQETQTCFGQECFHVSSFHLEIIPTGAAPPPFC